MLDKEIEGSKRNHSIGKMLIYFFFFANYAVGKLFSVHVGRRARSQRSISSDTTC